VRIVDTLFQDFKYALRTLTRSGVTTFVIVGTLALAMGTSAVMFTVAETILQSVPARDRDRVVSIAATDVQHGRPRLEVSAPEFLDWRERARSFDAIGAMTFSSVNLTHVAEPMRLRAVRASADFFAALGVRPQLGRLFTAEEDRSDGRVALLTDEFWRTRFAADPSVVGRTLTLDGDARTIVGVLPKSVDAGALRQRDVWLPLSAERDRSPRDSRALYVLGHLKPGVARAQATVDMDAIARQLEREHPRSNAGVGIAVDPSIEAFGGRGNVRFVIGLLMLMGAVLVWIACANVANVVLARAMSRRRELAVRSAVGASRFRIVRQLLVEDVVLSIAGGAAGLLLCAWEVDAVRTIAGRDLIVLSELAIDARVVLFALGVCLAAPIVFGLLPAFRASKPDLRDGLKDGARGAAAPGGRRLRGALVACQVALAVALLVEVGQMVRATLALQHRDKGFNPRDLLTLRIDLASAAYSSEARVRAFFDRFSERAATLPGVRAVGAADWVPIVHRERTVRFTIDGATPPAPGSEPWAALTSVTSDYRRAMEIPLISGRDFFRSDAVDAAPVALISAEAVRRYWDDGRAVGRHIRLIGSDREREIVGVIGDVWNGNRDVPVIPQIYVPESQRTQRAMTVIVRGTPDTTSLTSAIRAAVGAIDADQPVYDVKTMETILAEDMVEMYIVVGLLVSLAAIALGLAAAGVYGVVAYSVTQRTHEIGVRMALGARSGAVHRLIVAQGLVAVAIGAVVGVVIGFGLVQATAAAMRELRPRDPLIYAAVVAGVAVVALAASYVPARRATRIDPLSALRAD